MDLGNTNVGGAASLMAEENHHAYPEWNGSNGKNLLVYGEQGAGDAILVLRYAKLIKERGVRQMWVAQKP